MGKTIGHGARSRILDIRREEDGTRYAAKFVAVKIERDVQIIDHLRNEYDVLRTLHRDGQAPWALVHPVEFNKVRRFFRLQGAYLVLERIWGPSLAERHDYTYLQKLDILSQVCEALQYVHSRGYVHADLKPDNILVENELKVRLIDFGFAAPIGTRLGKQVKGTWGFLAPEQAGGTIDPFTDVYCLGAAMYWLFTGETIPAIMPDGKGGGFVPTAGFRLKAPMQINPRLPKELSDLILGCCEMDPHDRPPLEEVQSFLHDSLLRMQLGV